MNIQEKLTEKFNLVNKAFFETEGNIKFLRIEVNLTKLEDITLLSREISTYLDSLSDLRDEYFLDIYSSGTDKVIAFNEVSEHMDENVLITLFKRVKDKESFEGKVIELKEAELVIRWNAKGQFRKQILKQEEIKEIKLYAKVK